MRILSVSASLLLIAASTNAAEGAVIKDVRLGITGMSADITTDWTEDPASGASNDGSYDRETDGRLRVGISYVASGGQVAPIGLIWGIGMAFEAAEFSGYDASWDEEITQTWSGVIFDGQLGAAFAINEMFHLEAAGVFGFGSGEVEITEHSTLEFPAESALILEYGLRFGAYATLDKFQVGLETGVMYTLYTCEWDVASSLGGGTYGEDTEFGGSFVGLSLGIRL